MKNLKKTQYLCKICKEWFDELLFDINKGICLDCSERIRDEDLDDWDDPRPHIPLN